MRSKFFLFALSTLALSGCGGGDAPFDPNSFIVGKPLTGASLLSETGMADRTDVVVFDKTVRLIHQFDLTNMTVVKSLEVDRPAAVHTVLFDQANGMIADFSEGHVTVFDRTNSKTVDPINMSGKALSTAYDPAHGILVVYDDMNSVGLLRLDANGSPTQTWTGGPILQNDTSLTAGDLIDDGSLVLALADGSIAKVDTVQTLAQSRWVFASVTTTLGRMKWIAPVHGYNDRVLVLTETAVSLVSLTDGSVLSQRVIAPTEKVLFESKCKDAHVLVTDNYRTSIVYTDGTTIKAPSLSLHADLISNSRLSLAENSWSVVTASNQISWSYNSVEKETKDRTLRKYRLTDFAALRKKSLPDKAQLDVSEKFVFALYPSELGYGQRLGVADESKAEIKMFNVGHIH